LSRVNGLRALFSLIGLPFSLTSLHQSPIVISFANYNANIVHHSFRLAITPRPRTIGTIHNATKDIGYFYRIDLQECMRPIFETVGVTSHEFGVITSNRGKRIMPEY
jgi:hypothetical protein